MKMLVRMALMAVAMLAAPLAANAQPLSFDQLKTMVSGLGYTTTTIEGDTPKFSIPVSTENFNIPTGFEISKSGRYIWVTANLGASKLSGDLALQALHKIGEMQPTSFWLTSKNLLMIGFAIDNRDVTPAHLKFVLDKFSGDVDASSAIWQADPAAPSN